MGGGSDGGGVETKSSLSRDQRLVASKVSKILLENLGEGAEAYSGDIIAALIPELQTAREFISTDGMDMFDTQVSGLISQALSTEPTMDVSAEATEELYKKRVEAPMLETWKQDIQPAIREAAAGLGGPWSSGRVIDTSNAARNLSTTLSSQLAGMQLESRALEASLRENAMSRALQTVPMAEAWGQRNLGRSQALQSAAGLYQANEQNRATAAYQEFIRTQPEQSPWMSQALAFTGQSHMMAYQEAPESSPWGAVGSIWGAVEGAALGAPLGPMGMMMGASMGAGVGGSIGSQF